MIVHTSINFVLPDIDECVDKNGGCEQICNNIPGSFQCLCSAGFTLINEAFCSGRYNSPLFIFICAL